MRWFPLIKHQRKWWKVPIMSATPANPSHVAQISILSYIKREDYDGIITHQYSKLLYYLLIRSIMVLQRSDYKSSVLLQLIIYQMQGMQICHFFLRAKVSHTYCLSYFRLPMPWKSLHATCYFLPLEYEGNLNLFQI